jgi:hypothetical protein
MKSFKDYLQESQRVFNFRLKTVVPLEQKHRDILEKVLDKYKPVNFTEYKTIFQKAPMDFAPNVDHAEVYIIDFTLGLPISSYLLRQEIRAAWGVQEDYVLIKSENDPLEVYNQRMEIEKELDDEAAKKGLRPASKLGVTGAYPEYEQTPNTKNLYGNEYNSKFLELLAKTASERKENRIEPPAPLFSFLDYPEVGVETDHFNKNIDGAPTPVSKWVFKHPAKIEMPEEDKMFQMGNFDTDVVEIKKEYMDEPMVKKEVYTKKGTPIRKEKS